MLLFSRHSRFSNHVKNLRFHVAGLAKNLRSHVAGPSKIYQSYAGFTLLEMLLIATLIGILGSVVFANLQTARVKARDAKRFQYLNEYQAAIEQYFRDKGHYPINVCSNNTTSLSWYAEMQGGRSGTYICDVANTAGTEFFADALRPYLPTPLTDPQQTIKSAAYLYRSATGGDYCMENWGGVENMNNIPRRYYYGSCVTVGTDGKCRDGAGTIVPNIILISSSGAAGC